MSAGAEAFVEACRQQKLDFVVFVRHASSAPSHAGAATRAERPHDWKVDDQMRVLTPEGKAQCAKASWFRDLDIRAALTSPARRAAETAMRMTDRTETEEAKVGAVYLRVVAGVHPAGRSEVCERLFESMGYGPLCTFFGAEGGQNAFRAYGDAACAELAQAVPGGEGKGLAVFGHAVFLNAIAYEVACSAGASDDMKATLLDMDLGETQGIRVSMNGEVAKYPLP